MATTEQPVISSIPGASAVTGSKGKKSKKKAGPSSPSPAVAAHTSPEAPVQNGPAPVEQVDTTAPAALPSGSGSGAPTTREKGPVEELIVKRMRQLGKKLQRYRTYATAPADSLNADQRGALASLPLLEGIHKELEDLTKQVESVELEQAGKVREIRAQARREGEAAADSKVSAFQESLATPLSLFLRLYSLLHPARSSDHEHLTFARLVLPPILEDEVQATDVLRVGRMYEDLISGGEVSEIVIAGLVKGATGTDEENDHVHHLLYLLSQSTDAVEPDEAAEGSGEPDLPVNEPEVVPLDSKAPSEIGLPNGHEQEGQSAPPPPTSAPTGALNFLQEDELAEEESFEVVPHLAPHQPSALQPPYESYTPQEALEPPVHATSGSGIFSPGPAVPTPHFNWAEDEDEDDVASAQQIREAFALGQSAVPEASASAGQIEEETVRPVEEERPVIALVQENELATVNPTGEAVETPTRVEESSVPPSAAVPEGAANTPAVVPALATKTGHQRQRNASQKQPKPQPKPTLDEDGFQVVGRVPSTSNVASRGRGRGRGDATSRGRGGQGRGRGGNGNGGKGTQTSAAGAEQGEQVVSAAHPKQRQHNRQPRQDGQGQGRSQGQGQKGQPDRQPSQAQQAATAAPVV